ncbi:MAG: response regulator receiver protein [Pedosphaera sp.]|nr:response regulator receiver protein [Pedosphaera sp.]
MAKAIKENYLVLLVDDSEDDRLFMRMAFRSSFKLTIVGEVSNGEEAMAYLSGTGIYADRQKYPFPDLVLLDLKMPRFNGFEVLTWVKAQPFPSLKVVVLSGSLLTEDVAKTLKLGADAYHVKAASRPEQEQIVQQIEQLLEQSA